MKRVNRPYLLDTGNVSAWYETEQEALDKFNFWLEFYQNNIGKYGNERTFTLTKHGRKNIKIIKQVQVFYPIIKGDLS